MLSNFKSGRWAVCEDDSTIIKTAASKPAATKMLNELRQVTRAVSES